MKHFQVFVAIANADMEFAHLHLLQMHVNKHGHNMHGHVEVQQDPGCWEHNPGKFLGGYSSYGSGCLSEGDAREKCLTVLDCGGINKQHNECGGSQWTLRKSSSALPAPGYSASNLESYSFDATCRVPPTTTTTTTTTITTTTQSTTTPVPEAHCWEHNPGKFLGGYSSFGTGCLSEADAREKCATVLDCGGINKQHNECGGSQWTLRKSNSAAPAPGYSASNLESYSFDDTCRDPPTIGALATSSEPHRFDICRSTRY